jgi:hypothetical protein
MLKFFKDRLLLYPFIFGAFPILFLYAGNIAEVRPEELFLPLGIALVSIFVLTIALFPISRNKHKSAFILFTFLFLFYGYGHIHTALEGESEFFKQRYFFSFYLAVIGLALFALYKAKSNFVPASKLLLVISSTLLFFQLFNISAFFIGNEQKGKSTLANETNIQTQQNLPDIYQIILDGYGSKETLASIYEFNNSDFLGGLSARGFQSPGFTVSNYGSTIQSLASMMNYHYLDFPEGTYDAHNVKADLHEKIENNTALKFLKNRGYKYVHFSSGHFPTFSNANADYSFYVGAFSQTFTLKLFQTTLLKIFERIYSGSLGETKLNAFKNASKIFDIDSPKFTFIHVLSPHPPFLFDKNGRPNKGVKMEFAADSWYEQDKFVGQTEFINNKVLALVDMIQSNSKNPPVILIHSDHGPFSIYKNPKYQQSLDSVAYKKMWVNERFQNLISIYSPQPISFPDTVSLVNVFPLIFNTVFKESIPLLENRCFYDRDEVTPLINH